VQRGYVFKASGSWFVRYYDTEIVDGQTVRVQRAKRLADTKEYPSKSSDRVLADKHLAGNYHSRSQQGVPRRLVWKNS
jgi:hypothetical protein